MKQFEIRLLILAGLTILLGRGSNLRATSSSSESEAILHLLDTWRQTQHLVGIAAVVIRSNTIIGMAASGVKRQGGKIPFDSGDLWHLGSNTKAITATMIARLVEEGQLSWKTTPLQIFPELKRTINTAYQKVTIEQLLSHHAGIPPYTRPEDWPGLSGSPMEQRSAFAASVLNRAPATKPGTKGLYSNADYVIAAAMAERKMAISWEDLVKSEVLDPLAMHAAFGFPLSVAADQPWGHIQTDQ